MHSSQLRVQQAFAHIAPDRTPLFEIFQPFHPIHWPICGRTIATDEALRWDAMADGVAWDELVEADAQASFNVCAYFRLDLVEIPGSPDPQYIRPVKFAPNQWRRNGHEYIFNERTKKVELAHPGEADAYSNRSTEADAIRWLENWDGKVSLPGKEHFAVLNRVRELAEAAGIDWVYMGEIGIGTGVAFYPPYMLMWMLEEPELYQRWLEIQKLRGLPLTVELIKHGLPIIAMGGDVSSDKGPFISPALYHEYILPVIQEHVDTIHAHGAKAVYTSDGNHWAIQDDFFVNSRIDGYKEVDKAAGMTWERLIAEEIDTRVCILGNLDARYTMCLGTPVDVRQEVVECLRFGQHSPGGHILHLSHSVHEDVRPENYIAAVNAYREFFGLEQLP